MTKQFPELQREFMELCRQYIEYAPIEGMQSQTYRETVALWSRLIDEEVNTELRAHIQDYILQPIPIVKDPTQRLNELADIADDIADSIYVLCGLANAMGLPLTRVFAAVHSANLDKAVNGKILKRADGKILKPEHWVPANIRGILEEEFSNEKK